MVFALYHPAAALSTPEIERKSFEDVAGIPAALLESRAPREPPRQSRVAARQPRPGADGRRDCGGRRRRDPLPGPSIPDADPDFTLF